MHSKFGLSSYQGKAHISLAHKIEHTEGTESEILTTRNKALSNIIFYTKILQTTDGSKCRKCYQFD
jgi:hypothetical protein